MVSVPAVVRAYIGLIDAAVSQVREVIEHPRDLPVQAVSVALQASIKAQHVFTDLTIRGDEVLGRLRDPSDEAPSWARFDDTPPSAQSPGPPPVQPPFALVAERDDVAQFGLIPDPEADPSLPPAATTERPAQETPAQETPAGQPPATTATPMSVAADRLADRLAEDQNASVDRVDPQ